MVLSFWNALKIEFFIKFVGVGKIEEVIKLNFVDTLVNYLKNTIQNLSQIGPLFKDLCLKNESGAIFTV